MSENHQEIEDDDVDQEGAIFRCEDCENEVGPITMRISRCVECGGDMSIATDGGLEDRDDVEEGATDGGSPIDPEEMPKYLREGLEKQSAEDLRGIAAYAEQLADEKAAEAERELEEQADQETDETPEEWDDEEWSEKLDDALEKADIAPSKGTLTTKEIDGRKYFYLQWREGGKVVSQYVAPVSPSGGD